jgi:hypothetical protein
MFVLRIGVGHTSSNVHATPCVTPIAVTPIAVTPIAVTPIADSGVRRWR